MIGQGPRSGKNLVGVALVVAAMVAAGAGGMVLRPKLMPGGGQQEKSKEGKESKEGAKEKKSKEHASKTSGDEGHKSEDGSGEEEASAIIVDLGEFLVNLDGGTTARFLRAEVSVRLSGLSAGEKKGHGKPAEVKLPEGDLAIARDRVVTVLSSGVFEQLRGTSGREKLKQQMLARLKESLSEYEVHEVLFTAFVMQ